jgi:hypothetical protein
MLLKFKNDYDTHEKRLELASRIACIINTEPYEPTMTNTNDSYHWRVHHGNDWWVTFDHEHPSKVRIRYRYQCKGNQFEEALCGWLIIRFRCIILEGHKYE